MARLIPSFMDDRTPPGERQIFNLLASGPDDVVALHSLDLAPWNRGLRTEIDFVVIFPDTGIVCIEIKSHRDIAFDGTKWYPETITRSPFKQAADARFSFQRRLAELAPQFRRVPVVHCCIFSQAAFHISPNLSVAPWELIDARSLARFNTGEELCAGLRSLMEQSIGADARLRPLNPPLSSRDIERILACCVPIQKRKATAREEIHRREREIDAMLREQQRPVLQLAALNDRLVVSGAAGTGKTLIAIEVARRAAERGKRVGLLCFNQLVGERVRREVDEGPNALPNLLAGRAVQIMAAMTGLGIPTEPSEEFWTIDLPNAIEESITDPEVKVSVEFDYLVLDEAQDILARSQIWRCLMLFLRGGLEAGAFAFFGDFEHQVLAERDEMDGALSEVDSRSRPTHWKLAENCRNYRIVGETAIRLSGMGDAVYAGYRRPGGSVENFDIFFYEDDAAQLDKLRQWLRDFKGQGYRRSDITLLSFRTDAKSAASRLAGRGYDLRPAWQTGEHTKYASVHAFKGCESKIIILTDVSLGGHGVSRDLFYVGMTRATESVRVLCAKESESVLSQWLSGFTDR